jgi:hypothetical protein
MADCGAPVAEPEMTDGMAIPITFEPLLAGDRQIGKRMAKACHPLQRDCLEVSLS